MKMVEKLALQKELGGVLLFREGLFLKAYNESTYILTELLEQNLKIKCYQVKCLSNRKVMECSFPAVKLAERLPKAVQTAFGAQLGGDFDINGYEEWVARRWYVENEVRSMPKAEERPLQTVSPSAPSRPPQNELDQNLININLSLSPQQAAYIMTWHKGTYPIEVDLGFIESLKNKLIESNKQ